MAYAKITVSVPTLEQKLISQATKLHNFPAQPTPFIGREQEISELVALLEKPDCRLLTLVGPGGIGKTRLAIEVASRIIDHFSDGIWMANLWANQLSF